MIRRSPDQPLLRRTRLRLLAWSGGSTLVALLILGLAIYAAVATSLAQASEAQLRGRAAFLSKAMAAAAKAPLLPGGVDAVVSDPGKPGIVIGGALSGTIGMVTISMPDGLPIGSGRQVTGVTTETDAPAGNSPDKSFSVQTGAPDLVDADGLAAARAGVTTLRELTLNGIPVRVLSEPTSGDGVEYVIQEIGRAHV